ncbi:hydroxymethylglutaryl-CoA synthase [Patescibacteria group bacterium]
MKKVGVVGYGAYVPRFYINSIDVDKRSGRLGLSKKSLAAWDEDSVTMGVEAALLAMENSGISLEEIKALYFGSESPAYAVKPSSTIVADVLGVEKNYHAVDLQFACKAATAGLQMLSAQMYLNGGGCGLIVGSDKSQAKKDDVLEWSAGAAAGCLVVGRNKVIAELVSTTSVSSDTPDFWRRGGSSEPSHGGRFTGEPAYFSHVVMATKKLLKKVNRKPSDFNHVVFHMPNGRFPLQAAERLGFSEKQLSLGMRVVDVGNPYSASSLLGFISVLEKAKSGDLVLVTSYGSGAGSDSFCFLVTEEIKNYKRGFLEKMIKNRVRVTEKEYRDERRWK